MSELNRPTEEDWRINFITEMERAQEARNEGKEGRARTAARRAANVVFQEYIRRTRLGWKRGTVQQNAMILLEQTGLPAEAYTIIRHMLMRVGKDYAWPQDIDLLEEARHLPMLLLGEKLQE